MNQSAKAVLDELKTKLRPASVAQLGGFRPSDDPKISWFGKGVGLENERLPFYNGKEMFPLLQINVSELPFVPNQLQETKLLVVFFNQDEYPFNNPHGEGWLIREYKSLENLIPLPEIDMSKILRPFPILWKLIEDDAPGFATSGEIVDVSLIYNDEEAKKTFEELNQYYSVSTKVWGYPDEVQHEIDNWQNYVFQIGSEEKAAWQWIDRGTAYFFKDANSAWSWDCQFL